MLRVRRGGRLRGGRRAPAAEPGFELTVENGRADLQQGVRAFVRPRHLLLFHKPFGDHWIDRGFRKA